MGDPSIYLFFAMSEWGWVNKQPLCVTSQGNLLV